VPLDRFIKACNKAWELFQLKNKAAETKDNEQNYFFLNIDYSHLKVMYDDIMWVEGLKDYVKIHLNSSTKPLVARLSMKGFEEQLPSSMFIRIQKSYIVSKNYITAIKKNSVFIGTTELPVGENYKDAVVALLGKNSD
jgi:DNA-binding LytR/AlgR family response regulator